MNQTVKIVMLKFGMVFKRVFGDENDKDIIATFISGLLEIPRSSIRSIYINNVELTPELKLDVDGRIVNIEMQANK